MKRNRFSVEQIVAVLKQAELGLPVADVLRQVAMSEQRFYRWKKQYGGQRSDQVQERKQLVDENARLKKLVAELSLDKEFDLGVIAVACVLGYLRHRLPESERLEATHPGLSPLHKRLLLRTSITATEPA